MGSLDFTTATGLICMDVQRYEHFAFATMLDAAMSCLSDWSENHDTPDTWIYQGECLVSLLAADLSHPQRLHACYVEMSRFLTAS